MQLKAPLEAGPFRWTAAVRRAASWLVMRKVIVTGGSRGLGLAIVRRLICEGYGAIAVARQMNDQLAATIDHAERAHPGSIHFMPVDSPSPAART